MNTDPSYMMAKDVTGFSYIVGTTKSGEWVNFLKIHVLKDASENAMTISQLTTKSFGKVPDTMYGDVSLIDELKSFSYPITLMLTVTERTFKDKTISVVTEVSKSSSD